jgi:hypothetical protein
LVVQVSSAVQVEHAPPLQTRSGPQDVPFGSGAAALSTHVCVPVEQEVMPARQGSGLVLQASPAVQGEHVPALHTRFVPQLVPFASAAAVSTQIEVPVAHEVTPATQGLGFPAQEAPATQVPQTPPLQTSLGPQTVPLGSGAIGLSTHVGLPLEHEVVPARQASGFVSQAAPSVQETQVAALEQT